uniref:RFX1-4/6/8-like BCD domain-containing protein n=1 Tax=Acrobeloides nanus TaxID=290746 RepID=A0A914DED3_9BILA
MSARSAGNPMNQRLSQVHVFRLCTIPQIQRFVEYTDLAFYQVIIEILIPDVLSTGMTPTLTNLLRNFAKTLEPSLKKAMQNAPGNILKTKLVSVRLLAQTLKRYTSLNHLAQAARAVFQKEDQIRQMYEDFCRVDLSNVQEQAGWVCLTDPVLVRSIQADFKENLYRQKSLEQWAEWMEAVVDQVRKRYEGNDIIERNQIQDFRVNIQTNSNPFPTIWK